MTQNNLHPRHHSKKTRLIVGVNVVLFLLIGFGFGEEYLRNREIELEISRMESENAALESQKLSSLSLIDSLSSSYFVEGEARQNGFGKDGEQLIIVQNDQNTAISSNPKVSHDDVPNPLRWYYFFFDPVKFSELSEV